MLDGGDDRRRIASGYIQLRLEKPAVARRGDRFILRSYSPQRVIGGGRILDPNAAKLKAHSARRSRMERLQALDGGNGGGRDRGVRRVRRRRAGFAIAELARYGLARGEIAGRARALEKAGRLVSIEGRVFETRIVRDTERALVAMIEAMSAENKLLWGVDREELKERSALREGPLFDFLMEEGKREGTLFFKGGRVRAGSGERELSEADEKALGALEARIREAGFAFATKADLLAIVRDEKRLVSYLHILADRGSIVRISLRRRHARGALPGAPREGERAPPRRRSRLGRRFQGDVRILAQIRRADSRAPRPGGIHAAGGGRAEGGPKLG